MVDSQPPVQNDKKVIESLTKYIQEMQFFSDQIKFNATLHQGITMVLEKLTKIEEKLNEAPKKQ